MRRLPLYIVVETSTQMSDVIQLVNDHIQNLTKGCQNDPYSMETLWISRITFDHEAKVVLPLTELLDCYRPTNLPTSQSEISNLGEVFALIVDRINSEVIKSTAETKGDLKPCVLFFISGEVSDLEKLIKVDESFLDKRFIHKILCTKNSVNNIEISNIAFNRILNINENIGQYLVSIFSKNLDKEGNYNF